ncbi:MAG: transcription antitermination factor NusB [Clostridia bacterium]|nr:transcription antitermination factor NusB [Clostridia bacterium]
MTRKEAREQAFIIIFEKEFNNEYTLDEIIEAAKDAELFEADDFSKALAEKTLESLDKLDDIITSNLKGGWKISRISKVSLAILRLAICEMTQFSDIPVSVSINEAVELAKMYAAEEDASFINGLLASVNRGFNSDEE